MPRPNRSKRVKFKNTSADVNNKAADFSTRAGQLANATAGSDGNNEDTLKRTLGKIKNAGTRLKTAAKNVALSNQQKVNNSGLSFDYAKREQQFAHFIRRFVFMDYNPYFQRLREIEDNKQLNAFQKLGGLFALAHELINIVEHSPLKSSEDMTLYREVMTLNILRREIIAVTDAIKLKYDQNIDMDGIYKESKHAYSQTIKTPITSTEYKYSYMYRFHAFQASFQGLDGATYRGDAAKREALRTLKSELDKIKNPSDFYQFKDSLHAKEAYKVIQKSQGISTLVLKSLFNVKTTSEDAFETMLRAKESSLIGPGATL